MHFRRGRRTMVESLVRMAVWKQLFQPAARLLLALGEAETESWANNASGEFADLFSNGPGQVAPSEAPPSLRTPVLQEALVSASRERRSLGLKACERALRSGSFYRTVGPEYQGVRQLPDLWQPATYGELFDAYRSVWKLMIDSLTYLNTSERADAINVLLSSARGLTRLVPLADMVVETFRELSKDPKIDRRDLIGHTVEILHYDAKRMETDVRNKWEQLSRDLSGDDFNSWMERYVAMDLLEDNYDEEGQRVDQVQQRIEELAVQALDAPLLLFHELEWLVTSRARTGGRFGYELGKRDVGQTCLRRIVEAQANAVDNMDLSFIGGYLKALAENNPDEWDSLLDEFAQDPARAKWVVELTWRSGMLSSSASRRVLTMISTGITAPETLRIFRYGALVESLKSNDFSDWVDVLLAAEELSAVSTALDLLVMYGGYGQSVEPARKIVCHPAWFRPATSSHHPSHDAFWWSHVAKSLCETNSKEALSLARLMLEHMGENGTIVEWLDEERSSVLDLAVRKNPREVWQLASSLLGPPIDGRAYLIGKWLRGRELFESEGSHILQEVPQDLIWIRAEECPEARLFRLAKLVPPVMCGPLDDPCLARELLVRYGDDPRVRIALRSNFSTEGWIGLDSQHLLKKREWLEALHRQETNLNVLTWIDEYLVAMERSRDLALQQEEREGR